MCSIEGLDFAVKMEEEDMRLPSLVHAWSSEEEFVAVPKVQGYNDVQEKFRQKADANVVSIRMNIREENESSPQVTRSFVRSVKPY